jgi:pimeloyl-ACP methyl ester carboxylesterase
MEFFRYLKLPKMHLIGHHSGSAHAMEMAASYPDEILTVALSGPVSTTEEEQGASYKIIGKEWGQVGVQRHVFFKSGCKLAWLHSPGNPETYILFCS